MALLLPALLISAASIVRQSSPPVPQDESQPTAQRLSANIDPALQADLRRLMDDVGMDQLMRLQMDQMITPMGAMLKTNPQLTPAFVDEFLRRIKEQLLDGRVQDLAIQEYAKFFTHDEIQQMIAYQESPVGRKAKQVMPQVMSEMGTRMTAMSQELAKQTLTEIAQEHPEYINKPEWNGAAGGVVGGGIGSAQRAEPDRQATPPTGQRVDAKDEEARLIKKVPPEYPPLAKAASVQGTVKFTATIGPDGKVESVTLISGHPLLVNAAKQAVLQWQYEPLTISGKPVEVITDVQVNFKLGPADK